MHHFSADAFPLKRTIYKELSNKKTIILHCALQPANVGTLDSDNADLRQRPLLAKTNRLSSPIQVQLLNDFLHSGEVKTFAIFEILSARGTKCDLHWLIRSTDDAGLQVTGWSPDFKLTHYPVSRSGPVSGNRVIRPEPMPRAEITSHKPASATNLLDEWISDLPLIAEVVAGQLAKIACPAGRQYTENRFQRQSASPASDAGASAATARAPAQVSGFRDQQTEIANSQIHA